jgi:predicted nucleic acid-binding protein
MITAVDTNIILDVLIPNEPFSASSKNLLERYLAKGKLVLCEIVLAELASQFPSEDGLKQFLLETGMRLDHSNEKSFFLAGRRWLKYIENRSKKLFSCSRCGHDFKITCPRCREALAGRFHVLADFLIGAHALEKADCLLSRDLGIYKTYFSDLRIIGTL